MSPKRVAGIKRVLDQSMLSSTLPQNLGSKKIPSNNRLIIITMVIVINE